MEYLKVSVANLLSNHEKLHAAFAHSPFIQTNSMAMTKADETFLKTLNEVIVANMQNPDFCLDDDGEFAQYEPFQFEPQNKRSVGHDP